jgi:TIR domain-containing protein
MDKYYDIAISFAGENKDIVEQIYLIIKEKFENFKVFYSNKKEVELMGADAEEVFEEVFTNANQVIVVISKFYKKKEWTKFEWEIISKRNERNKFNPIRLDDSILYGLSNNIIYYSNREKLYDFVDIVCHKVIAYEKENDLSRPSESERIQYMVTNSSGELEKSFQLKKNNQKRISLEEIKFYTDSLFEKKYEIIDIIPYHFSQIKRFTINILLIDDMVRTELDYIIKLETMKFFNRIKPDGLSLFIYRSFPNNCVARADYAPYGDWSKIEEGYAYNLPISVFDWKIEYKNLT